MLGLHLSFKTTVDDENQSDNHENLIHSLLEMPNVALISRQDKKCFKSDSEIVDGSYEDECPFTLTRF